MTFDFEALAATIASGLPDVRACVVVSGDGLVLGGYPELEQGTAADIWGRLIGLGEIGRGFVTVRDQIWVFCRRGPYGALAVTGLSAIPGVVLDRLERMLLLAEESRTRREGVVPGAWREPPRVEPGRRSPRSLHPEHRSPAREEAPSPAGLEPRADGGETAPAILAVPEVEEAVVLPARPVTGAPGGPAESATPGRDDAGGAGSPDTGIHRDAGTPGATSVTEEERDPEVDIFAIAREFSGLFTEEES